MDELLIFPHRQAFRDWLGAHGEDSEGVWLLFGKKGGPATLSAHEALEEALCFGWIDGQMQSLDDTRYRKYFARRILASRWSDKNKRLAQELIDKGIMAPKGLEAVERARASGQWEKSNRVVIGEEQIAEFRQLVQPHEPAYTHLLAMPLSVQRTYTGFYLDAKSEKTRQARLAKIIERLDQNLKPM